VKIATFNANSLRARMDIVLRWLDDNRPDVLCVQETKVQDKDFPLLDIESSGYNVSFRGQKSYNGVAVLSLEKQFKVSFGFDDRKQADETRLACVKVGPVYIVNTYVPQGREIDHEMYRYKLEWFKRLNRYFKKHFTPRSKLVWVGDLNIAPEPIDIHNPEQQTNHVCFHKDVREAFAKTVQWGFVDVFRKHHPEPGQYTFFDYRVKDSVKRHMGWRVDHILASRPMAKKSNDCWIDLKPRLLPKASDHTFLTAEFDV